MLNLYDLLTQPDQGPSSTLEEKVLLYALVQATNPKLCVETGTNRGATTAALALALPPDGRLHTFDPVDYGAQQRIGALGIADRVIFHQCSSLNPPDSLRDVRFIFFDVGDGVSDPGVGNGKHTYEYLLQEWAVWRTRLAPYALCLWHDGPPGSEVAAALSQIAKNDDLPLCPLVSGHGLILGVWRASFWWDAQLGQYVRTVQERVHAGAASA